jgi:hypothetical protein
MTRLTLLLGVLLLTTVPASGQGFGIGGQLGDPSGLSLRFGGAPAFDLAAGWNLSDNALFAQGHVLLSDRRLGRGRRSGAGAPLNLFYGPGLFVGVNERSGRESDVAFGLSFNAGLSYYTGPIEIFGQLTPRLQLVDRTDFDLGWGVGLRFYP